MIEFDGRTAANIDKDLTAAPATPLVLTILSEGESYGYAILERVRELSGGQLEWADAMVYPLFHRLRRLGYLTTEWRTLPEGRRRIYYTITDQGRAVLASRHRQWLAAMHALSGMWGGTGWLLAGSGELH
jgi:DNA-binding PadR family transcriptional regulator